MELVKLAEAASHVSNMELVKLAEAASHVHNIDPNYYQREPRNL
jgi:hypothetical protein